MTDRPLIMSAPMVRALLEGRKSQTRRVLGRLRRFGAVTEFGRSDTRGYNWHFRDRGKRWHDLRDSELLTYLPFVGGDRLWVRETWQLHSLASDLCAVVYRASVNDSWTEAHEQFPDALAEGMQPKPFQAGWASPIHMPRWASRLTLTVTDVRVERLQDISEADARMEGVQQDTDGWFDYEMPSTQCCSTACDSYRTLWNSLHGPDAWAANPWVCAVTFTTEQRNIDAPSAGDPA